jgi:hypothetical protein
MDRRTAVLFQRIGLKTCCAYTHTHIIYIMCVRVFLRIQETCSLWREWTSRNHELKDSLPKLDNIKANEYLIGEFFFNMQFARHIRRLNTRTHICLHIPPSVLNASVGVSIGKHIIGNDTKLYSRSPVKLLQISEHIVRKSRPCYILCLQ